MVREIMHRAHTEKERSAIQFAQSVGSAGGWEVNKYPYERQWMVNLAFLMGHQDIAWDRNTHRPVSRKLPRHRSNYVANKILPMVERAQAEICESTARWAVKPRNSSREYRAAARFGKQFLAEMWDEMDMQETKLPELALWAITCGTGFLYNTVKTDPRTKERIYIDPRSGQTLAPSMIGEGVRRMLDNAGSYVDYMAPHPDVEVLSPFRIMVDPDAESLEKARTMQHWSSMSIDEVWERWGVVVPVEALPSGMLEYERRLRSFFGPAHGITFGTTASTSPESSQTAIQEVISKPYVEKRHGKWIEYPEGRHVILAGGVVVHDDVNNFYKLGFKNGFPITDFRWHQVPGRFWGESMVTQELDPQKAYNDVRRREQDNFRLMGQPKWISPFGANLKKKSINDAAGEVIEYNFMGGGKPEQVTPTPFHPSIVSGLAANAMADMQDAASQHDLLRMSTPSEMRLGPIMELAREGDRIGKRPVVGRMEKCVSQTGSNLLITAAEVMSDSGLMELVGDDYGIGAGVFRKSLLKGIRSVKVIRGSMEAGSAATDAQKALDSVQAGGLDPASNPGDRAVFLEALNYEGYDPDIVAVRLEREVALRENDQMFAMPGGGEFNLPPINDTDLDEVHLQVHGEEMRSPGFKLLPVAQQEAIRGHYQAHAKRVQGAMREAERRTLVAKGAPGQKGTPSPPKRPSRQ